MGYLSALFFNLDEEKQQRILDAALSEFAQEGFEHASTNEIVRRASIGKGRLFHYFSTKRRLFQFLLDYSTGLVKEEYVHKIDQAIPDLFERCRQASRLKMEFCCKHPHVYDFFGSSVFMDRSQQVAVVEARRRELSKLAFRQLATGIDTSLFRPGIDCDKAVRLIIWSIQGFESGLGFLRSQSDGQTAAVSANPWVWDQLDVYLGILRTCYYADQSEEANQ